MEVHPDIAENVRLFGCAHLTGGRRLPLHTAVLSHEEQEARLSPSHPLWVPEKPRLAIPNIVSGAHAYNSKVGLAAPSHEGLDKVQQTPDMIRKLGRSYDSLPMHDKSAEPAFHAMRDEVANQYHHLTHTMGIKVEPVDHDPYAHAGEMMDDLKNNKRLKVMKTSVTGSHPFFSDEENDKFRAVHDAFGHAATGRDFSRHGEEAAFRAHAQMFSPKARPAMASETRGQNGTVVLNGEFGPQKVALMPKHLYDDSSISKGAALTDGHEITYEGSGGDVFARCWHPQCNWEGRTAGRVSHAEIEKDHNEANERPRRNWAAPREPWETGKDAPPRPQATSALHVHAHDSGDGETIYHCPFCGSGQVLARSDRTIECEFCHTCFTVQVQPQYSAFPQTINGQPVQVPGMPGQVAPDPMGGAGMPGQDPALGTGDDPAMGDGVPPDAPPAEGDDSGFPPTDGGEEEDDEDGDDDKDSGGGNQPPWLKKSTLTLRTATGAVLPSDEFLRSLALRHAGDDRDAVLAAVRASRG